MITQANKTFVKLEHVIPDEAVDRALRLLHLEIVNWGLPKEQFEEWHQNKTWFPTLRHHEPILALADYIPDEYKQGTMAEPQILLHFPDEATEWPIEPHQDKEPDWAVGQHYTNIIGVALSDNTEEMGGLMIYDSLEYEHDDFRDAKPVNLSAGDVIVFNPKVWHASGLNRTGKIRYMVYFRFLEED